MNKYNKEELESLINDNYSYEAIGAIYNCTGSNIKKVAKRLGIELQTRRKKSPTETFNKKTERVYCLSCNVDITHKYGNMYCNKQCESFGKKANKYNHFLTNPDEYKNPNCSLSWLKPIILKEQLNNCDICGCDNVHNQNTLIFVLDHIDGNAANNVRSNLRLVCPNCDSQLDTYKSKNKNSARVNRYKGS